MVVHLSCVSLEEGYLSLLHFEAIRIGPELSLRVHAAEELPVDRDVFALEVVNRNGTQLDFKFYDFLHQWREAHFDQGVLFRIFVVIGDRRLLD